MANSEQEPDLKKKIVQDLLKAGFAAEFRAVRCFREAGWECNAGYSHLDLDENVTRDVDLRACRQARPGSGTSLEIIADVKKSERPRIVFKDSIDVMDVANTELDYFGRNLPFQTDGATSDDLRHLLWDHSLLSQTGWIGYGIHEFQKPPDSPSRWYAGSVSTCKASRSCFALNEKLFGAEPQFCVTPEDAVLRAFCLMCVQPTIILAGQLFSAETDVSGEIVVEEIPHALVRVPNKTPAYRQRERHHVAIVQLEQLPSWIQAQSHRVSNLGDALLDRAQRRVVASSAGTNVPN